MLSLWPMIMSCFLLGVGSTLHPCPLSTNVAVIALMSSWAQSRTRRRYILTVFILSYVCTFMILALLIAASIFANVEVAQFMNRIMSPLLGPMLIIAGMFHCRLLAIHWSFFDRRWKSFQEQGASYGSVIALAIFLALAFCPATAALFFGILMPLVIQSESVILLPAAYALGAALPLLLISVLLARSLRRITKKDTGHWSEHLATAIGVLLILIGLYVSWNDIFAY